MEVLAKKEFDLIAPYGGKLVNLIVEVEEFAFFQLRKVFRRMAYLCQSTAAH
jgi:hypothetical protein